MSQAVQSNEPPGELIEENQEPAIEKLDELIAGAQLQIKAEPEEEFLFESLNCGDLFSQTSSQQSTDGDLYASTNSQQITSGTQDGQPIDDPDVRWACDPSSYLEHNQAIYSQPIYSQPTCSQSAFAQSAHNNSESTYFQPYDQTNSFQSTYSQSTCSQSTYNQFPYSQSTYSQSAYSSSDHTVYTQDSQCLDRLPIEQSSDDQYDWNFDSNLSQPTTENDRSLPSSQSTGYPFSSQQGSANDSDNTQGSQQSELFPEDKSGDLLRRTILTRLEILMKVLYGKGLLFNDRILVAKKCWENANFEGTIRMNYRDNGLVYQRISRPTRIALLMMAAKIYLLLAENRVSSRRQIYYEEKHLFSACKCYELIEQVCAFVNLSRRELNVIASGKGLVAGSLVLLFENRTAIDVSQFRKGCLIPDSLIYLSEVITNARWILVIEKHAIFSKLVDAGFHLLYSAILITSKGFPDVYTRELANILSDRLGLRTFGLFDCDPFGIDIYCCFKFGSVNLVHHSVQIASPRIVWLGIYPSEIAFLRLKSVQLTETDERRLASLLKRVYLQDDQLLSNELVYMRQMNVKCGLQDLEGNLFGFILQKVDRYLAFY